MSTRDIQNDSINDWLRINERPLTEDRTEPGRGGKIALERPLLPSFRLFGIFANQHAEGEAWKEAGGSFVRKR